MAVLSDYTDGTITVTNGSVDFTGTNTLWRSAAFREGDTVLLQGFTGVIAGTSDDDPLILSNTAGQFTEPWPGASGTFAYRMRYQPDNARFSAKSTMLINLLANGILRGIADIGVEDGKLLIGNVAGLYDLIDKSELGIQDPNGSLDKLAALTLAARQILQTDADGALKAVALAANKFLRTDANADIQLSDITAAATALMNLSGTASANQMPYFNADDSAALTPLTSAARTLLDDQTVPAMRGTISAGKPVFKAHLAANQLVYNGTTNLSFTASPLNVGNCWSGGTFTAPEAGMYFFSMGTTMGDGYGGQFIVQIFVNGSVYSEMVYPMNPQSVQQYYRAGTLSAALQLAAGGTVQFKLVLDAVQGNPMMQAFRNFATGFLI